MSDHPSIAAIQNRVARQFGVRVADIRSDRRGQAIVWPRHVAMWLCRELTPHSLPQIARHFGGRDHTTVMYAIRRIEDRMERRPDEASAIRALAKELAEEGAGPPENVDAEREAILGQLARLLGRRSDLLAEAGRLDREIDKLGRVLWDAPETVADNQTECGE